MRIERALTLAKSTGSVKANSIGRLHCQRPKSGTEMLCTTNPAGTGSSSFSSSFVQAARASARIQGRVEDRSMVRRRRSRTGCFECGSSGPND